MNINGISWLILKPFFVQGRHCIFRAIPCSLSVSVCVSLPLIRNICEILKYLKTKLVFKKVSQDYVGKGGSTSLRTGFKNSLPYLTSSPLSLVFSWRHFLSSSCSGYWLPHLTHHYELPIWTISQNMIFSLNFITSYL